MKKLKIIVVLSVGIFFLGNIRTVQSIGINEEIYGNVFIENIDVSHLTKEEAKLKVEGIINKNDKLSLVYKDKVYKLNLNDIDVAYKIDESIETAYKIGRNKDIISNVKTRINLKLGETKVVKLDYVYDNNKMENYIKYIQAEINVAPENASINVENKILKYKKEVYGENVDYEKLKNIIMNKLSNEMDKEYYEIPLNYTKPDRLYSELIKIDTILGEYETYFNSNTLNRVNNIRVAANVTSDVILNKSDEFSFNNYVSNKSIKYKFKNAPVIINGQLKDGLGGGICQVSSTIYNAALYSGLEITHVRNHSIPSAYVSKGRDATVATGSVDLKFKNNYNTPIFIHNEVYKDKIVCTIYGNKQDKKNIEIVTEVVKNIPNKTKYKNSDELYKGEREVFQKGRMGYKVNTFRVYKGVEPKREFISESYYPPEDEIIIYGTKEKHAPYKNHIKTEVI